MNAFRVVVVLALVGVVPGWASCRALAIRRDWFAAVWLSLAVTSVAGLLLAYARAFSPAALLASVFVVVAASLVVARVRPLSRAAAGGVEANDVSRARRRPALIGGVAVAAAVVAFLWCWPPFDTVLDGSDSTMYVSSGVHLARTGKLTVTDTVIPLLPPTLPAEVFPSVSLAGSGPYIRLPGGLLMPTLAGGETTPAFFPLLSVWTGIFAAAGGPDAAPAVAPVFAALAVCATVLFAGETLGGLAAATCALLLIANYALWWFGRFPMPEIVTLAFLWGGLVLLARAWRDAAEPPPARDDRGRAVQGRAHAFCAGLLIGVAGLARTETFLVVIAAYVVAFAWQRVRFAHGAFALGFALPLAIAGATVATSPSHHLAYLGNDVTLSAFWTMPEIAKLRATRWFRLAVAAPALLVLAAGVVGWRRGIGFLRGAVRVAAPIVVGAAIVFYLRLAGALEPARHVGWLAAYCSWPLLVLAAVGCVPAWRRGGGAVRFLLVLTAIVAALFIPAPRVAPYQPWAIRRFLPVVIPAIAFAAAAALAAIAQRDRRLLAAVALAAAVGCAGLELRPVLVARQRPFYAGNAAAARSLAALLPEHALVVVDSGLSDLQIQVPLWLIHGRETVVVTGGTSRWRDTMTALVASGRPTYWITRRSAGDPVVPGLSFRTIDERDLAVFSPSGPADAPTRATIRYLTQLRVSEATQADGGGAATEPGNDSR